MILESVFDLNQEVIVKANGIIGRIVALHFRLGGAIIVEVRFYVGGVLTPIDFCFYPEELEAVKKRQIVKKKTDNG